MARMGRSTVIRCTLVLSWLGGVASLAGRTPSRRAATAQSNDPAILASPGGESLLQSNLEHGDGILSMNSPSLSELMTFVELGEEQKATRALEQLVSDGQAATTDFNAVLGLCARLGRTQQAEKLLKQMRDASDMDSDENERCLKTAPNLHSYNLLLEAYIRSDAVDAGRRSRELLQEMKAFCDDGEFDLQPDSRTYASVIQAMVKSGKRARVIDEVEQVYEEARNTGIEMSTQLQAVMIDAYASQQSTTYTGKAEKMLDRLEHHGVANEVIYNTVLKALKTSSARDASDRAETILKRMEEQGLANTISYTTVIGVLANKGGHEAARRAQHIFDRIQEHATEEDDDCRPNTQTYNSLIHAWVRAGELTRAEALLKRMEESDDLRIQPSVITYSTLMKGYTQQTDDPNVATRALDILERLLSRYRSGDNSCRPNLYVYTALIPLLSPEKAQSTLYSLYDDFRSGNPDVKPNALLVRSVLERCQTERGSGERAEAILDWFVDLSIQHSDDFAPNEFLWSTALTAWSKSHHWAKASRARLLLDKISGWHATNPATIPAPNVHCYTAVLNACAYQSEDGALATKIAIATYRQAPECNHVLYATFLTVLQRQLAASKERTAAACHVWERAVAEGKHRHDILVQKLLSVVPEDELIARYGADWKNGGP